MLLPVYLKSDFLSRSKYCRTWPDCVPEWLQSDFIFKDSPQLLEALQEQFCGRVAEPFHTQLHPPVNSLWRQRQIHKVENPCYFKLSFNIQASPAGRTPQLWAMSRLPLCCLLAVSRPCNCLFRSCWLSSETHCYSQYNCRGWKKGVSLPPNRALSYGHTLLFYMSRNSKYDYIFRCETETMVSEQLRLWCLAVQIFH